MKTSKISIICATIICAGTMSFAQVAVSETTTTQSSGTISDFSPNTIVLKTETSSEPVRYTYSKTTTFVDETGSPVDISVVKSGLPVQVIYAKEGDGMVARKIIVHKQASSGGTVEKHESTTTTTESQ